MTDDVRAAVSAVLRLAATSLDAAGAFVVGHRHGRPAVLACTPGDETGAVTRASDVLALEGGGVLDVREPGAEGGAILVSPRQSAGPDGPVVVAVRAAEPRAWPPRMRARVHDAAVAVARILADAAGSGPVADPAGAGPSSGSGPASPSPDAGLDEDWLAVVLEALPAGVLVARAPGGEPVRVNAQFVSMIRAGRTGEVPLIPPLYAPEGPVLDVDAHPFRRGLRGEQVRGELLRTAAPAEDGAWWRTHAAPIRRADGTVAGVVWIVEDVTEARGMQDALYRSQEHLLHAQKMEAVGRLAGGMAHDFNNLLTAIMGFGELLLEEMGRDDPGRVDAEEIVRSAARGRDLTAQLLSFSRRRDADPAVLELSEAVASSRRLLERLLDARVRLETRLDPRAGRVRIDRTELEQVVVNLAVNARDALGAGGGTVRVETSAAEYARALDAEPEAIPPGRWTLVTVADDGAGMDAAVRARIFEPFFTTKPPGQGTGLGLATVYGIVKRAGGFIRVDSRAGEGSRFEIHLPPADDEAAPGEAARAAPVPSGTETVLLVEDQDQIRSLLARQLERSGFRVLEAAHGQDALERWAAALDDIDVVVSDVVMPVLDGPSMVDRLRAIRPGLPVVFISGYPGAADPAEREIPLPDALLLRKPFAAGELVAAIRSTLDQRRRGP